MKKNEWVKIKRPFTEYLNSVSRPGYGFLINTRIEKENTKQDQLDRIEAKLDKLLGPKLINGVWR
jgi:protein tyrosine phosphatase (PTP) superfamily phosphohydrolase (DUF442 family)